MRMREGALAAMVAFLNPLLTRCSYIKCLDSNVHFCICAINMFSNCER